MRIENGKNIINCVMLWFTQHSGDTGCNPWFKRNFLKTKV